MVLLAASLVIVCLILQAVFLTVTIGLARLPRPYEVQKELTTSWHGRPAAPVAWRLL